jgi:hypothetical protein
MTPDAIQAIYTTLIMYACQHFALRFPCLFLSPFRQDMSVPPSNIMILLLCRDPRRRNTLSFHSSAHFFHASKALLLSMSI